MFLTVTCTCARSLHMQAALHALVLKDVAEDRGYLVAQPPSFFSRLLVASNVSQQAEAKAKEAATMPAEVAEEQPEKAGMHKPPAKGRRRRHAACLQESVVFLVVKHVSSHTELVSFLSY